MSRRSLAILAAIIGAAVVAVAAVVVIVSSGSKSQKPPIVLVHGYSLTTGCPGGDVRAYWSGLTTSLIAAGWTNDVVPVSYYECDVNGINIDAASSTTAYFGSGQSARPDGSVGYSKTTDLRHLAYALAWYVYKTYSSKGRAVDLVGHSMGGLLIRWAMSRVAAHDSAFPPSLKVANVVTVSTPYGGANASVAKLAACKGSPECAQFAANSSFLKTLSAGPAPLDTDWTTMGGGACDLMTAASATAARPSHTITWTQPCYQHGQILFDDSQALDTTATFSNPGDAAPIATESAPHSLAAILRALQSTSW